MLKRIIILVIVAMLARPMVAQTTSPASQPQRAAWATLDPVLQSQLKSMLDAPDWAVRVFAMLRMERYADPEVDGLLGARLKDKSWQVRCFAIRAMSVRGLVIDPAALKDEKEARVVRTALRSGVNLPKEDVQKLTTKLMRSRNIEEAMLGLEIAAASDIEPLRIEALKKTQTLITGMDDLLAALLSRRLAAMLRLNEVPQTTAQWRIWLTAQHEKITLPPVASWIDDKPPRTSLVAEMDDEAFTRLQDYLTFLKQRDLDMVIVMDATASMIPMVNQARAGVDALILFLSDISREMRLAFIAYRDHDNAPVWDGHPFTTDITSIRKYLFDLRVTGGADYPEAVLQGLEACGELKWNKKATRQIVLVGDAPPHEGDVYRVRALLESMREAGVTVHAVHVPMEYPRGTVEHMPPNQAEEKNKWLNEYNTSTEEMFASIANTGGGQKSEMTSAQDLVPAIMHFTIEEGWWPVFDEFYAQYLELCR